MIKMLAKCAVLLAFSVGPLGCAASASDEGGNTDEVIRSTHEALTLRLPSVVPIYAEATQLPDGRTVLDVALTPIPHPVQESDEDALHNSGNIYAILVYVDRNGRRDLISAFDARDFLPVIGVSGGCKHVFIRAGVGDKLYIGAALTPAGQSGLKVGAAPVTQVVPGQWPFSTLDDHQLPPI